jgi:UDP-glucuronate decarboxylase
MMTYKNILITGGLGFIGLHLARELLKRDAKVYVTVLDNLSNGTEDADVKTLQETYPDQLKIIKADVSTYIPDIPFDEVYHLAATRGTKFAKFGYRTLTNNILSTLNIVERLAHSDVKVVFASTGETFGSLPVSVTGIPTPEDCPVGIADVRDPRWTYALSKIVGEMLFLHREGHNRVAIVRMQNPYGPRMGTDNVIPIFINKILHGDKDLFIATPNDTRPFTYVDDVVDGLIRVMEAPETDGKIVNLAHPDEIEIWDMVNELVSVMGKTGDISVLYDVPPVTVPERRCLDVSFITSLGWSPTVALREGLEKTVEWYTNHHVSST